MILKILKSCHRYDRSHSQYKHEGVMDASKMQRIKKRQVRT